VTILLDPVGAWPDDEPPNEFGYPPGRAGILVHRDFRRRHPEAYRLLSQVSVPLDAVNESIYRQVVLGETSDADLGRHAREWIEANRETVDRWLAAAGLRWPARLCRPGRGPAPAAGQARGAGAAREPVLN